MRVIVCGGRDYANVDRVRSVLGTLFCPIYPADHDGNAGTWLPRPDLVIVTGAARGADSIAIDWAVVHWCQFEEYPADWDRDGKAAGPIRNKLMLDKGADLVIAFPGGRGTDHMKKIAREAKVPVLEVYD